MKVHVHQLAQAVAHAIPGARKAFVMEPDSFLASTQALLNQGWHLACFRPRQPWKEEGSETHKLRCMLETCVPRPEWLKKAKNEIILVTPYDLSHALLHPVDVLGTQDQGVDTRLPTYYIACLTEPQSGLQAWRPGDRVPLEKHDVKSLIPDTPWRAGRLELAADSDLETLAWRLTVPACLEFQAQLAAAFFKGGSQDAAALLLSYLNAFINRSMVNQLEALTYHLLDGNLRSGSCIHLAVDKLREHAAQCDDRFSTVKCAAFPEGYKGVESLLEE